MTKPKCKLVGENGNIFNLMGIASRTLSYQALSQKSASAKKTETTNPKYTFRTWLLRLGLIGKEFETARLHLLKNLEGDSAFRNGRQVAGL